VLPLHCSGVGKVTVKGTSPTVAVYLFASAMFGAWWFSVVCVFDDHFVACRRSDASATFPRRAASARIHSTASSPLSESPSSQSRPSGRSASESRGCLSAGCRCIPSSTRLHSVCPKEVSASCSRSLKSNNLTIIHLVHIEVNCVFLCVVLEKRSC